jgi:hypothetical protein
MITLGVLARRPGHLLGFPFWLDESWVVASVRAPLGQLELMTSSTPIGWTLLLRLVPPLGSPERYRLLPLAFAVAAVVPAWLLGRRLGGASWRRHVTGVLVALPVAVAPAALARPDLKQYTADVLVTLTLLALVAALEARWTTWRLLALAVATAGCALISHATAFVALAAFVALGLVQLTRRRWRRLLALAAAGLAAAAVQVAVYLAFTAAGNNPRLQSWWTAQYVPLDRGPGPALAFVGERLATGLERAGFGAWPLALALVVLGAVGLWRAGCRAAALFPAVLTAVLVAAGAADRYPLLEQRTSLFHAVLLTFLAAAGVATAIAWLLARRSTAPLALVVAVAAAILVIPAATHPRRTMPVLGAREQVEFLLANRRPDDAIVVNHGAQYGFAYYWPGRPTFVPAIGPTAVRYSVAYPLRPDIVLAYGKDHASVEDAVAKAVGTGARRVWIVLGYGGAEGINEWTTVAGRHGRVTSARPDSRLPLLLTIDPAKRGAAGG